MPGPELPRAPSGEPRPSVLAAVRFVFEAPDAGHNLLIGAVFALIPIVGLLVLHGFLCEVVQRLERRHPRPVPRLEFSDFGHYLGRGAAPFVVALVLGLLSAFLIYGILIVAFLGAFLLGGLADNVLAAGVLFGVAGLVLVLVMAASLVLVPASVVRAELTERIGEGFALGKVLAFARLTWGQLLYRGWLMNCVLVGVALLGYCLCFVGVYAAIVVILLAQMHLRWQIYRLYLARGGEAIPLKPAQELPSEAPPAPAPYPPTPGGWR